MYPGPEVTFPGIGGGEFQLKYPFDPCAGENEDTGCGTGLLIGVESSCVRCGWAAMRISGDGVSKSATI